jgi:hypothetical protein
MTNQSIMAKNVLASQLTLALTLTGADHVLSPLFSFKAASPEVDV